MFGKIILSGGKRIEGFERVLKGFPKPSNLFHVKKNFNPPIWSAEEERGLDL